MDDGFGLGAAPKPPRWWLVWKFAVLRFKAIKAWRPSVESSRKAGKECGYALGLAAAVAAGACAVAAIPMQVALWADYASDAAWRSKPVSGESFYGYLDNVENQALWSAAVAGASSDESRRRAEKAWSAASRRTKDGTGTVLWLSKGDVDDLLSAEVNLSALRKEAAISALVESLSSGGDSAQAMAAAKTAVLDFAKRDELDPKKLLKTKIMLQADCKGLELSEAMVPGLKSGSQCKGVSAEMMLMYWMSGSMVLAIVVILFTVGKWIFAAFWEAMENWAYPIRSELMSAWERKQVASASKGSPKDSRRPNRI